MTGLLANLLKKSPRGRENANLDYKSVQTVCQDGNEKISFLRITMGDGGQSMVRLETEYERRSPDAHFFP
jgi:hypothetical protein